MKLALDLDSLEFVDIDDLTSTVTTDNARKGDILPLEIHLVKDGSIEELSSPTINVRVTPTSDYDTLITSASSFAQVNSGRETYYLGTLDLSVAGVASEFTDGTELKIETNLEVEVTHESKVRSSVPLELTIQNSYVAP